MPTEERIRSVLFALRADYELKSVSLFGSYANGSATEKSDLDLLVEFEQPAVSLFQLNELKYALEDALGLPVDLIHAPMPKESMLTIGKVVRML